MKRIKVYLILLLFLGSSAVIAQATKSAAGTPGDPKLSPEEKALLLTAGEDNPAKIDEAAMVDPKMDPREIASEDDYGPSNAKPAEGQDSDPRLEAEMSQNQTKKALASELLPASASMSDQPAGDRNGTITDYRNMAGSNDQSRGDEPNSILNYREISGSNQQPAGDSPNK